MRTFDVTQVAFYGAAAVHFAGVLVNVTAPWIYNYRANLPKAVALRQIFVGQVVWVTLLLGAMGGVCVRFQEQLAGMDSLGRYLAVFLLTMWTARLAMQIAFFKSETRVSHPVRYYVFLSAFVYQVVVFGAATLGWLA